MENGRKSAFTSTLVCGAQHRERMLDTRMIHYTRWRTAYVSYCGGGLRGFWKCMHSSYTCILLGNRPSGASLFLYEFTTTYSAAIRSTAAEIRASEICRVSIFFDCALFYFGRPVRC